jgi:oligopeptide transport system substrate-binding protein
MKPIRGALLLILWMSGGNPANVSGYVSEAFDSLMQRAAMQVDPDRRRLYLEEAERVLLADHAIVPLYFYVSKHLVRPEVQGWRTMCWITITVSTYVSAR